MRRPDVVTRPAVCEAERVHRMSLRLVLTLTLLSGCTELFGPPTPTSCAAAPELRTWESVPYVQVEDVDLLFVVDNSGSMAEEQASLAAELPRLITTLSTGDINDDGRLEFVPVRSLHVGVVSTDMGTGGHVLATCVRSELGDDGILRTVGRTDIAGCVADYPSFLEYGADREDPEGFAGQLACVARIGTGGCGFEQPLEAMLKALSPAAPTVWTAPGYAPPTFLSGQGHGDGAHAGFLRRDALLAVLMVTDEDDCSVMDPSIFDLDAFPETDLNLRCTSLSERLFPIRRYVAGLISLRAHPAMVVFVPIVGIPPDLVPASGSDISWPHLTGPEGERDARLVERVDPSMPTRLVASCNVPGRGQTFPPARILQVAQQLEIRGAQVALGSICQESFTAPIDAIARGLSAGLGGRCVGYPLIRESDGSVACEVTLRLPIGRGCSEVEGASALVVDGLEVLEEGLAVCTLPQQVQGEAQRSAGELPTEAGWTYDDHSPRSECSGAPGRLALTTSPPPGTEVRIGCGLSTWRSPGPAVGDPCEVDAECWDGRPPRGASALMCDEEDKRCAIGCSTSASCNFAGLADAVCTPRGICVPAACEG